VIFQNIQNLINIPHTTTSNLAPFLEKMKTSFALLTLCSLLEFSSALVIPNTQKRQDGVIRIPLSHKQKVVPFSKRDGNGVANLYSDSPMEYAITINLGTPAQPVQVTLDTGR
jgi:hypothetical protein